MISLAVEFHFLTEESMKKRMFSFGHILPKLPLTSPKPGQVGHFFDVSPKMGFPQQPKKGLSGAFQGLFAIFLEFSFVIPGTFHDTK